MELTGKNIHLEKTKSSSPEKLLNAAEELFAEKGFKGTLIRQITEKANCNLAAVNYHFGGKDKLYLEIFRRRICTIRDMWTTRIHRMFSEKGRTPTLETLLATFARTFIKPFADKRSERLMQLIMSERLNQHLPRDLLVKELIEPIRSIMKDTLMQVCPNLNDLEADLCIHSIVGQLSHLIQVQKIYEENRKKEDLPILDQEEALDHIVKFSAAGIRGYAEKKSK